MSKFVTKLIANNNYTRPTETFQEKLSQADIEKLLLGYQLVDDISQVALNTHVRYFKQEGQQQKFRMGGFLHNKSNSDKYVMLSNGKNIWSVQTDGAIFFEKLSHNQEIKALHRIYRDKIQKRDLIINDQKKIIANLMNKKNEK